MAEPRAQATEHDPNDDVEHHATTASPPTTGRRSFVRPGVVGALVAGTGTIGAGLLPGLPDTFRTLAVLLQTVQAVGWAWVWLRHQRQCHRAALAYVLALPTARSVIVRADGSIEVHSG